MGDIFEEFARAHQGEPLPDKGARFVESTDVEAIAAVEEVIERERRRELADPRNALIVPVSRYDV